MLLSFIFFLNCNCLDLKPACPFFFFFLSPFPLQFLLRNLKGILQNLKPLGVRSLGYLRLSASAPCWTELVCGSHMSNCKHILGEPRSNCCHFLAYKQYRTCWHWKKKNEQTESTSEKGSVDASPWNVQTVQMTTSYSYKGLSYYYWHWSRLSNVPLFLGNVSCIATLPWKDRGWLQRGFFFHFSSYSHLWSFTFHTPGCFLFHCL